MKTKTRKPRLLTAETCAELAAALVRFRQRCGMDQKITAQHVGVCLRTVKRWERGLAVPDPVRLSLLARFLEITSTEYMGLRRLALGLPANDVQPWQDTGTRAARFLPPESTLQPLGHPDSVADMPEPPAAPQPRFYGYWG